MTTLSSHRILIGASGWRHNHWHEQFYPEDLPEDWQLAYYGNEFPVVLIREQEWQQDEVESWLDETDDLPLFVCELPLRDSDNVLLAAEPYLEKIRLLGKRCIGIVCQLTNTISADTLSALLNNCNELAPSCVDMEGDIPESLQAVLQTYSVNTVWKDPSETSNVTGALVLANIHSDKLDLKILRQLMDHLLSYDNKERTLVLIMSGEPPNLEMMKQAKVLLELL